MAGKDELKRIHQDLKSGEEYVKSARRRAERVGDTSGAEIIRKLEEKHGETRKALPDPDNM